MAECKHELKYLVGMADGIHCRACGKIFPKMPAAVEEEKKPAPKKGGKTSARKQ